MDHQTDLDRRIERFRNHLREVARIFNEASRQYRLGVSISAEDATSDAYLRGSGFNAVLEYSGDGSGEGELHAEQIETAVEATANLIRNTKKIGLIQGAMQSGKTTTSLALQLAAPVYYLVTGQPLYPVYLLTVHTSQARQTRTEFEHFLHFYSDLRFVPDNGDFGRITDGSDSAAHFTFQPSLRIYRDRVLRSAFEDLMSASASPEEFIARRTRGKAIRKIADRIQAIVQQKFRPLMILDEPQFGILDRVVPQLDGEIKTKPTVFKQILEEIEGRLKIGRNEHSIVALSATPYEMYDVDTIWVVHQQLGETYRGFNFIAGDKIDKRRDIKPPKVQSLSEFGQELRVPALGRINVGALDREERYLEIRRKLGLDDDVDHKTYFDECVAALRAALVALVAKEGTPNFGVCIRAKNQNYFARNLEALLNLAGVYDVIQYNGPEAKDKSVKLLLASRKQPEIPYLMIVTNRARMGDAFPRSTKYFVELSDRYTDMNAMFQGLLGRACGYAKDTCVVVSQNNATLIRDIVSVDGRYIYRPSQGAVIIGEVRRGRPITLIAIRRDPENTRLEKYFKRVEHFVSARLKTHVSPKVSSRRSTDDDDATRYAPLLADAENMGVFEHVESDPVRKRLFPALPGFRILRSGEYVESVGAVNDDLTYQLDPRGSGGCRVVLREDVGSASTGGIRARGRVGGGAGRTEQQDYLEPKVLLRKYDVDTGAWIADHNRKRRRAGVWRVAGVVFPLKAPVRALVAADGTLPRKETAVDPLVVGDQRAQRDEAVRTSAVVGRGRRRA